MQREDGPERGDGVADWDLAPADVEGGQTRLEESYWLGLFGTTGQAGQQGTEQAKT